MAARLPRGARVTGAAREALSSELTARYEAGESIRSMAGELGRSYGFVQALLKEAGVTLRTRGGDTRGAQAVAARQATEAAVEKVRAELAARSGDAGTGATADEVAAVVGPAARVPRSEEPEVDEPVPPVVPQPPVVPRPPVTTIDEPVEQARRTGAKGAGKAAKSEKSEKSERSQKSGKKDAKRSEQNTDAKSKNDPKNKKDSSDRKKSDKDAKKSDKKDVKKSDKKDPKKSDKKDPKKSEKKKSGKKKG